MSLFNLAFKQFELHSGQTTSWKIDCDALSDEDIKTIALLISCIVPEFGSVEGVPQGGLRLAAQLEKLAIEDRPLLIVDDVLTTGQSMYTQRNGREAFGAVIFARRKCPVWVRPLWTLYDNEKIRKL